jgi:hypothetical protein
MPKPKKKTAAEKLRGFLSIFNPGAASMQGKTTPEMDKATAAAKKAAAAAKRARNR